MKKQKTSSTLLTAVIVVAAAGLAFWRYSASHPPGEGARKIAYYQDSMHPWIKSAAPGKCTICAMDLTPIYEGEHGFGDGGDLVMLSSNSVTVMNVQTEEVRRRPLQRTLRVAGVLEADSTRKTIIAAPAPGRIDNVRVESAGVDVRSGQVLCTFYSPDLTFTTRRYIFRDRMVDHANSSQMPAASAGSSRHVPNPAAALRNNPLNAQERAEGDPYFNDLLSTQSGTVIERSVYDGQYVAEGDRLFTIVDCSVLWFRFDVYEHQLAWLEPGQPVDVTVPSIPGKVFPAVISVIEPSLNDATRTAKVRADVTNAVVGSLGREQRLLRLGMYADGQLRAQGPEGLAVPRGAVLFPGGQAYAYVEKSRGAYELRRVKLGRQGDDRWEILDGLSEGDRVVTSGNVLIDAQAQFNQSTGPDEPGATSIASGPSGEGQAHDTASRGADDECAHGADLPAGDLTEAQQLSVTRFLALAHGISDTLASDSLSGLKPHLEGLPKAVQGLAETFPAGHPWRAVLDRLGAASHWSSPADLAAARKSFLPFSTNVVQLVQNLRQEASGFGSLKVFFCPMAPKPGLWFQSQGPLRNPYYGSRMLSCGEEVRPPAAARPAAPKAHAAGSRPAQVTAHAGHPEAAGAAPAPAAPRQGIADFHEAAAALSARSSNAAPAPAAPAAPSAAPARKPGSNAAAQSFLSVADELNLALTANDLSQCRTQWARLPAVLPALEQVHPGATRANALIRRLTLLSQGTPPEDADGARRRFILVNSNAVELARLLRKADPTLAPSPARPASAPESP